MKGVITTAKKDKKATKTVKEYLKSVLTKEEVAVAANELAEELDNLQAHEDALTAVKAEFKAKIEKSEAEIRIKQRLVRDKYEHRYVECDKVFNYTDLTVTTARKDTSEVIQSRSMTESEKQMTMEFDKD